jgi:hypothetical protein
MNSLLRTVMSKSPPPTAQDSKNQESDIPDANAKIPSLYMEKTSASLGSGLIRSKASPPALHPNSYAESAGAELRASVSSLEVKSLPPQKGGLRASSEFQEDTLDQLAAAKTSRFLRFLEKNDLELAELRKLAWLGVPDALRQIIWLMLLV